jgi:small subunit ribosomal protein S20
MPTKAAAFKAERQTKKHGARNTLAKLQVKDATRAVRKTISAKEKKKAEAAVLKAIKLLDKAYSRGIMKLNTVSRQKSRLLKALHAMK